jgi:tRNA (guanine37-N1)-methyltransferase
MVLKPEPLFEAVESLVGNDAQNVAGTAIVLLSASGKLFDQPTARRLSELRRVVLICGRYEGVDERVAQHLATDEISIGDFVLSGGELPAAMIVDAITRLLPGALGNGDSAVNESFSAPPQMGSPSEMTAPGDLLPLAAPHRSSSNEITPSVLLDFPHYTRPASFRGWDVPEILLSGNHEQIRVWRRQQAVEKTRRNRPELLNPRLTQPLAKES